MDPNDCIERGTVNCTSAGRLLASIFDLRAENVPYMQVYEFFGYSKCLREGDNYGTIVQSYEEWTSRVSVDDSLITHLTDHVTSNETCKLKFCQALEFTGNADFAGIGVMVSFCIQIVVATCFALLYLLFFFGVYEANLVPFRGTFKTFFISSIFFNVAIGLAATATIIMEGKTQYTALFASLGFLLSLSSTQTLWALYMCQEPSKPRGTTTSLKDRLLTETNLIRLCLAILWVDLLVVCIVIINVDWKSKFEIFCFHHLNGRTFATRLLHTPIGLIAIGIICAVVKKAFPRAERSKRWDWLGPAATFLGLIVMWLAFGTAWFLREKLGTVAGKGYQDNHWGFGQFAAVAALLPTLVDIIHDSYRHLTDKKRSKNGSENQSKTRSESGSENRGEHSGEESRGGQNQGAGEGHEQGQEHGQGQDRTGDGGSVSQQQARAADFLV